MNHFPVLTGWAAITPCGDFSSTGAPLPAASTCSGTIADFELASYLSSRKNYLDRCSALALGATAATLRAANWEWPINEEIADDCGIALGTHLGCLETMRGFWQGAQERGIERANSILFSHSYFNSPISLCAIEYNLRGYHGTFCSRDNSGLDAMRTACEALQLGHAQMMLCGGVEAITPTREACEPQANMSEASAFCALENAELAAQRGAQVLATLDEELWQRVDTESARQTFGDCGGALGALAVLQALQVLATA